MLVLLYRSGCHVLAILLDFLRNLNPYTPKPLTLHDDPNQATLEEHRHEFAKLNVYIRPRLIVTGPRTEPPEPQAADPVEAEQSPEKNNSPTPMTPTTVVYIKVAGAVRGVMQLHKAACPTPILDSLANFAPPPTRLFKHSGFCRGQRPGLPSAVSL